MAAIGRVPGLIGLLLSILIGGQTHAADTELPDLATEQLQWLADQIFRNECNRDVNCLTSWNVGEDFPSLGIGHFIWYRADQQERFVESFPALLAYYVARGTSLPAWLAGAPGWHSPWPDRETFQAEQDSERMRELRQFLLDTRDVQADFIVRRMHEALPTIAASAERPAEVTSLFYEVANTAPPFGMYALIDYINFKGEGTSPAERYEGEGWGLLQVLEYMLDHPSQEPLMEQFAAAAQAVLARRIENSPPERQEERWRNGWNNRTLTYIP